MPQYASSEPCHAGIAMESNFHFKIATQLKHSNSTTQKYSWHQSSMHSAAVMTHFVQWPILKSLYDRNLRV